jgi:hypothetical protein
MDLVICVTIVTATGHMTQIMTAIVTVKTTARITAMYSSLMETVTVSVMSVTQRRGVEDAQVLSVSSSVLEDYYSPLIN